MSHHRTAATRKANIWKATIVVLVASFALVQLRSAMAAWTVIVLPNDGPIMEPIAVCRNGMVVGIAAPDELAEVGDELEQWRMLVESERTEDEIQQVRLNLKEQEFGLRRFDKRYPYRQYIELSWPIMRQSERLQISFNDFRWKSIAPIRIEDCRLGDINHNISVIGDNSHSTQIEDHLEFEVRAEDCPDSNRNGCGIHHIHFFVVDPFGEIVHEQMEKFAPYCAFSNATGSSSCNEYDFSDEGFEWPNGEDIEPGEHILRAIIRSDSDTVTVVQTVVTID